MTKRMTNYMIIYDWGSVITASMIMYNWPVTKRTITATTKMMIVDEENMIDKR